MDNVAVVYWSGGGNTAAMAEAIANGLRQSGAGADIFNVASSDLSSILSYDKIAFGCPSMGDEVLEESEFEPYFQSIEAGLGNKKIALFGSYGWGDGLWMREWESRVNESDANFFEKGFIQQESPDETECEAFGARFAGF